VVGAAPFVFRGLRCIPSRIDPSAWFVLPNDADLERDASGRLLLTMIDLGSSAYLLFTARWAASPGDLDALRAELATRGAAGDPGAISLSFPPIESPRCDVLLRGPDRAYEVIASSATSGYPPYNAAFNLTLEGDRLAAARAAAEGEPGVLMVEYHAGLPVTTTATASFRSTAELLPWLRAQSPAGDVRALLDEAIRSGRAEIHVDMPEPGATEVVGALYDRALTQVERLLSDSLDQFEQGEVRIEVSADHVATEQVRALVDVGELTATTGQDNPA
jgi:hypothetical protein